MGVTYDKYYKEQNYFGKPYPGLVDFFEKYPYRTTVLDLGCGQGRDSLFLGRIGYCVTGVDISTVGIEQLNEIAQAENLEVKGVVGDIYSYSISDEFDIILLDSILHFYKNDFEKEKNLLMRILDELKNGGILCNFMQKGSKRESELKKIIKKTKIDFEVLLDGYTKYPEYNAEFHMYVIKKHGTIDMTNREINKD